MRMNNARKRNWLNVTVGCFVAAILGSSIGWAADKPKIQTEFFWSNYQEPFTEGILILQRGGFKIQSVKLDVEIPQDLPETTLVLEVQSFVEGAFEYFTPFLKVEGASKTKKYTIPVEKEPAEQRVELKLKDLFAGKNTFNLSFQWKQGDVECAVNQRCGYGIKSIYFQDVAPSAAAAEPQMQPLVSEFAWADYRKPIDLNVQIQQNECAPPDIAAMIVDLPANFLQNVAKRTLTIELESNSDDSKGKGLGFDLLKIYLNVNGAKYSVPVNDYPAAQVQQLAITSKDLRTGQNTLQASFEWTEEGRCCNSYGCGYTLKKLSFE